MHILRNPFYMLWTCLLLHLLADFWMQGCLADLKQRDWWDEKLHELFISFEGQNKSYEWQHKLGHKYRFDFIAALVCHSAMWTIMMMFPLMWFTDALSWSLLALANILVHMWVDQMKANAHQINLITDQVIHAIQVIATVFILML